MWKQKLCISVCAVGCGDDYSLDTKVLVWRYHGLRRLLTSRNVIYLPLDRWNIPLWHPHDLALEPAHRSLSCALFLAASIVAKGQVVQLHAGWQRPKWIAISAALIFVYSKCSPPQSWTHLRVITLMLVLCRRSVVFSLLQFSSLVLLPRYLISEIRKAWRGKREERTTGVCELVHEHW